MSNKSILAVIACVIAIPFILLLSLVFMMPMMIGVDSSSESGEMEKIAVSPETMQWYDEVVSACNLYGIPDQVNVILAIIEQESGGSVENTGGDIMQSSECIGLPPNSITDPLVSIDVGVSYYASNYELAGGDMDIAIQAYNYGSPYVDYALANGGYSLENAQAYSDYMANEMGWDSYGDPEYVPHVKRYFMYDSTVGDEQFQIMMNEMLKYQGTPYVWGGDSPEEGFDCSGLTQYAYSVIGLSIPRTASEQWNAMQHITLEEAKPGDLIFFENTYKEGISHVGIYCGNDQMYHAGDVVGFADITLPYWQEHYAGCGRYIPEEY